MEDEYFTLKTIFEIVKNDPSPETYLCSAREIILRQSNDWNSIYSHLQLLADKELVVIKHLDKIAISITALGIEKVKALLLRRETLY